MFAYLVRRLLWMIPLLWAVATVTFLLMHAVPGGPFDREKEVPPTVLRNLEARYGLDKPLYAQYGDYLWRLLRGDLGISYRNNREVSTIIREGFTVSMQVGVLAFVVATGVGMTLGIVSALNRNGIMDYVGVFFATVGAATPNFILATFLVIIFSVQLGWFDVLGWEMGNYRKMVLPVVSLATLPAAYIARVTRASMIEVLQQDYIRTARAKGLRETTVVLRHAVKNAMIPVLTVLGPIFAILVTGSFIIERTFQINGIGRRFVDGVFVRDYGIIMGTTLFYVTVVAVANLVVDILYAYVDPRIRY
ncbi:MAG TPA: ABC transporter permease [Dehalococcoidia bacterium]|nr:ABC transporter permease [Dehalococcoidia bacterium]